MRVTSYPLGLFSCMDSRAILLAFRSSSIHIHTHKIGEQYVDRKRSVGEHFQMNMVLLLISLRHRVCAVRWVGIGELRSWACWMLVCTISACGAELQPTVKIQEVGVIARGDLDNDYHTRAERQSSCQSKLIPKNPSDQRSQHPALLYQTPRSREHCSRRSPVGIDALRLRDFCW
jgi:hypothetical protein